MGKEYKAYYKSDIGIIEIISTDTAIVSLDFVEEVHGAVMNPYLEKCITQIDEYFKGKRKEFDLHIELKGTEFQKKVWTELTKIPYGTTASYKDVAVAIENEKAVRAVGNTNRNNKIAIIVPCHRVIGASGNLTGYAGGLWRKQWLLEHEKKWLSNA